MRREVISRSPGHHDYIGFRLGVLVERDRQLRLDVPVRPERRAKCACDETNACRMGSALGLTDDELTSNQLQAFELDWAGKRPPEKSANSVANHERIELAIGEACSALDHIVSRGASIARNTLPTRQSRGLQLEGRLNGGARAPDLPWLLRGRRHRRCRPAAAR